MAGIHCGLAGSGDGYITVFLTLAANTNNYTLNTAKVPNYVPGITRAVLTINSGVVVGGGTSGVALTVDTSWNARDKVEIVNLGTVSGFGGEGGFVASLSQVLGGIEDMKNGAPGGTALSVARPVAVTNSGVIQGGGGGGGVSAFNALGDGTSGNYYAQGGGGAGTNPGAAGGRGNAGENISAPAQNGTATAGGSGGVDLVGSRGGNGGAPGQPGQNGTGANQGGTSYSPPGNGGAAGNAVVGNSNITWVAMGTRLGPIA